MDLDRPTTIFLEVRKFKIFDVYLLKCEQLWLLMGCCGSAWNLVEAQGKS
tara:strand:+ start:648 stop:797 length:150 start_codon:yes stop_codon:yes gene_type:complete